MTANFITKLYFITRFYKKKTRPRVWVPDRELLSIFFSHILIYFSLNFSSVQTNFHEIEKQTLIWIDNLSIRAGKAFWVSIAVEIKLFNLNMLFVFSYWTFVNFKSNKIIFFKLIN